MSIIIQLKRATSQELSSTNPVLAPGEPCLEIDTNLVKYGDGITPWNDLEYSFGGQPIGSDNVMSDEFCSVFGLEANASNYGQASFSSGKFSTSGDAQFSIYHLRQKTTSAKTKELFLDGRSKRLFIDAGMTWNFDIKLTAHNFTDGTTAVWNIRGGIERIFNDEEASLIGQPTIESCGQNWNETSEISVTAANNALTISVTGVNNKTVYWYATVNVSQIKTPAILKPIPRPIGAIASSLLLHLDSSPIVDSSDSALSVFNNGVTIDNNTYKFGNGSGYFNNSYLEIDGSSFDLTNNFTVEFWINLSNLDSSYRRSVLGKWISGSFGWLVQISDSAIIVPNSAAPEMSFPVALNTGTWYHIAIVRNSGVVKCFINGVANSTTFTNSGNFSSSAPLVIGRNNDNGGIEPVTGYIDDIRITKNLAIYTNNFIPPQSALLPYAVTQNLPPIPPSETVFIDLSASSISTLDVTCGGNHLHPSFDLNITDYYVKTTAISSSTTINYSVNLNGADTSGQAHPNQCLRITVGQNVYYVRFLPSDIYVPTVSIPPQNGYIPGWYITGRDGYFAAYSEYGVPVWYMKFTQNSPFSLHKGSDVNRMAMNFPSGPKYTVEITETANLVKTYNLVGGYNWDIHDIQEVSTVGPRKGNVMGLSYVNGFYLQEMDQSGQKVWEWSSSDYFNVGGNSEYFHTNSVDIHPITGNILISSRHTGTAMCIDYNTKQVLWVLQGQTFGSGTAQAAAIPATTANVKWLTPYNEPTVNGVQYQGTRGNHDARWRPDIAPLTAGNEVFSIYDDQSGNYGSRARGVVYEVDLVNNRGIFRTHVYHDSGVSGYMGSYTIVKEADNTFTHTVNYVQQHPSMVEYAGDSNGNGSQTKTLALDFSGDNYRLIKVRRDFLNIDYMRNTAGTAPIIQ